MIYSNKKCSGQIKVASVTLRYTVFRFVYIVHLRCYQPSPGKSGLDIGVNDIVAFETCNGTMKLTK